MTTYCNCILHPATVPHISLHYSFPACEWAFSLSLNIWRQSHHFLLAENLLTLVSGLFCISTSFSIFLSSSSILQFTFLLNSFPACFIRHCLARVCSWYRIWKVSQGYKPLAQCRVTLFLDVDIHATQVGSAFLSAPADNASGIHQRHMHNHPV